MNGKRKLQLYFVGLFAPLAVAFYSQYVDGFHPCELCIWQRWAYAVAILFFILHMGSRGGAVGKSNPLSALPSKIFLKLSTLSIFAGLIISVYHVGIEYKWWEGFQTCTNSFDSKMTIEQLRDMIEKAPAVRCDQATWVMFGLSMAAWNAVYSALLTIYGMFLCRAKST